MLFMFHCVDKAGHAQIRADNRADHLAHLKAQGDKLKAAGPLTDDAGEAMIGSLIVLDLADRAEAETFAADDPYAQAGLFESVTIAAWKKVLPAD